MLTAEIPLDRMFVFVALDTLEMVAIVQVLLFPFILFDLRLKTKTERKQNKTKKTCGYTYTTKVRCLYLAYSICLHVYSATRLNKF